MASKAIAIKGPRSVECSILGILIPLFINLIDRIYKINPITNGPLSSIRFIYQSDTYLFKLVFNDFKSESTII